MDSFPLGLELQNIAGRRFLTTSHPPEERALSVEKLRLELARDARSLSLLQRTHTTLRDLTCALHEAALLELLTRAAKEVDAIEHIDVRLLEGCISLGLGLARGDQKPLLITCRATVEAPDLRAPQRLVFYDFRAYCRTELPPRKWVRDALSRLLHTPTLAPFLLDLNATDVAYPPHLDPLGRLTLHLPKLLLLHLFATRGWKVPSLPPGLSTSLEITRGSLRLALSDPALTPGRRAVPRRQLEHRNPRAERVSARQLAAGHAARVFLAIDRALFDGRVADALELIESDSADIGLHPDALERMGYALLCHPSPHHLEDLENLCSSAMQTPDTTPLAHLLESCLHRLRGDMRKCTLSLRHHLSLLDPREDLLERTYTLLSLGHDEASLYPTRAIAYFREAIRRSPGCVQALEALDAVYARQGQHAQRVAPLRRLLSRIPAGPQRAPLELKLACLLLDHAGEIDAAAEMFQRLLEVDPRHLEALKGLARAEAERGNPMEALRILANAAHQAEHHAPEHAPELHLTAARLWLSLDNLANARLACQSALSVAPDFTPAMELLARTYVDAGEHRGAIRCLEPMVLLLERRRRPGAPVEPALIEAYHLLARARGDAGQTFRAIDTLRRLLSLAPYNTEAFEAFQAFCLEHGQPEELIDVFQTRLENASEVEQRVDALRHLARLYNSALDLPEEGLRYIRQAVSLQPDNESLLQTLARLLERVDNPGLPPEPRVSNPPPADDLHEVDLPEFQGAFGWPHNTTTPDAPSVPDSDAFDRHLSFGSPPDPDSAEPFRLPLETEAPDWRIAAKQWSHTPAHPGQEPQPEPTPFEHLDATSEPAHDSSPNFIILDEPPELPGTYAGDPEAPNFVELETSDLPPRPAPAPRELDDALGLASASPKRRSGEHRPVKASSDAMLRQWPFDKSDVDHARPSKGGLDARRKELEAARRQGDNDALRDLLKDIIDGEISLETRARLRQELAFLAYYELEDLDEAKLQLDLACEEDPDGIATEAETLTALEGIAEDSADHVRLLDVYRRKLERSDDEKMQPVYHLLIAQICWERLGRPGEAKRHLGAVLEAEPDNESALRTLADIEAHLGFYEEAAERLSHLIELFPEGSFDSLETLSRLGKLYMRELERFDAARVCFERILEITPTDLDAVHDYCAAARANEANLYLLDGLAMQVTILLDLDLEHRRSLFDTLGPEQIPDHLALDVGGLLWEAADLLSGVNDHRAFHLFGLLVTLNPEDPVALEHRIDLARKLKRWDILAASLERWADMLIQPAERFSALAEAGFVYRERLADNPRATSAFQKAMAPFLHSELPKPPQYERVVNTLEHAGNTPPRAQRRAFLRDSTVTADQDPLSWVHEERSITDSDEFLGVASHSLPRLDEIEKLLALEPPPQRRAELLTEKAAVLSRRPETQRRAINTLRAALSVAPDNVPARLALADGLIVSGEFDHALNHIMTLAQRYPAPEHKDIARTILERLDIILQTSEHGRISARARALQARITAALR